MRNPNSLPQWFLNILFLALAGYALFGRGFSYLGVPPLYVGEVLLLFALLIVSIYLLKSVWRSPIFLAIVLFALIGAANTFPYVKAYGLDSFRDAAQWGYSLFAIAVAIALLRTGDINKISEIYGRFARIFLLLILPILIGQRLLGDFLPHLPWGPGGSTPFLTTKSGDIAVHLSGILIFMLLPLGKRELRGWIWPTLLVAATLLVATISRSAALSILLPLAIYVLIRPSKRIFRIFSLLFLFLILMAGFDIKIDLGREGRSLSVETFYNSALSIISDDEIKSFSGTKEWRLLWWDDIIEYTIFGDYFFTGKGFGINLADDDGYQVLADGSLRSPHNSHMTLLARGGVPMFSVWVLFVAIFAWKLTRSFLIDKSSGRSNLLYMEIWILLYWTAFLINATFDVYLEGPQGAIWFWSLTGVGIAHLIYRSRVIRSSTGSRIKNDS